MKQTTMTTPSLGGIYDSFYTQGVQIIPGVFSREEVETLRIAAESAVRGSNPRYPHTFVEHAPSGAPAIMFFPALCNTVMDAFRTDERLLKIVQDILGKNVKQLNNQFYFRYAGDGDSFAWHTDKRFRDDETTYPGIGDGYLQTAIIVDDWTEENGAVEYIKGSHKTHFTDTHNLRGFRRNGLWGEKIFPKAGDVAIWSVLVIHGSEQNVSTTSRSYYMNGFAKAECANEFPYVLWNGEVIPLDEKLIP